MAPSRKAQNITDTRTLKPQLRRRILVQYRRYPFRQIPRLSFVVYGMTETIVGFEGNSVKRLLRSYFRTADGSK